MSEDLEGLIEPGVFQRAVCRVPHLDPAVEYEVPIRDRRIPNFVVALTLSDKTATSRYELTLNLSSVLAANPSKLAPSESRTPEVSKEAA